MKNNRLKTLRTARHMTQEEVANQIGESKRTYASWERGERDLPNDILVKLAAFFHVSADTILGIEPDFSASSELSALPERALLHAKVEELTDAQCSALVAFLDQMKKP